MTQERGRDADSASLERDDLSTADLAGRSTEQQRPSGASADLREAGDEGAEPLFPSEETQELRDRWQAIQAGFVDEPRKAVEAADGLVASAMKRLAEVFAGERERLEAQWDRGDDVSTEDLRVALRRYRSFFDRLLSM
jgi:hypothetical protein